MTELEIKIREILIRKFMPQAKGLEKHYPSLDQATTEIMKLIEESK